ncbi:sporulation protein [Lederbergia lenta]|uniref:Lipoprotein n=1 Tax=Lederbergia lenta TaxID=1467 RepID=A0A2X4Z8Z1_LEDLE|nr:sporulation protein [Lederbergia lenta]MCM3110434.1 sporulation protein [Lederbergia lenta]MEC2324000.1 sporulation protein [Lederbergia lenta]SQI60855.1 lipoprotein [Lederbergia lenta]
MINKIVIALFTMCLLFIATGCTNQKNNEQSELSLVKITKPAPIELNKRPANKSIGYQVRKEINNIPEIYDTAVIEGEKEVIVVYKVKHLHRFKMRKIEKELKNTLNEKYPKDSFIVSSDYKIFLEAIRLKEDLDDNNLSNKEAEKRYKKIIKLKKELN